MEAGAPGGAGGPEGGEGRQPTEEEVRAALEEQMKQVRVEDLVLQSVASLINLTARRIAKEDERDLDQARVGIEAVRALSGLLPEEAAGQVRQALSELQMLYARESGGGGEEPAQGGETQPPGEPPKPPPGAQQPPGGGGDRPSGLWTPRGS
ncbi:MAG TPA: hypothetical protein VKA89_12695 [Solirubrobacterales bacterium]|nr:hypothetical protein [Solirubrobacterales bacterium]